MTFFATGTGTGSDYYSGATTDNGPPLDGHPVDPNDPNAGPWHRATPGVDDRIQGHLIQPSAYQYGQTIGGASSEENRYAAQSAAADARTAPELQLSPANEDLSMSNQARGFGQDALSLARNQAYGGVTPAMLQYQQGLQQAQNNAAAMGASARGLGIGSAAYNAANQQAAIAQQGVLGMNALRANEMAAGRQLYGQQATGIRQQDLTQRGQSQEQAFQQAQDQMRQTQLNDARNLAYEGMRQQVFADQDKNAQAGEAQNSNAFYGLLSNDAANRQMDLQNTNQLVTGAANTASGLIAAGQTAANNQGQPKNPYGDT